MLKVNNKDTRTGVFIVNFEHISYLVSIVNFEQANAGWIDCFCKKISTMVDRVLNAPLLGVTRKCIQNTLKHRWSVLRK